MPSNPHISRRMLLQSLGLGGATLYLPSLARPAKAQPAIPKRLVIFYTQHSSLYDNWKMHPPGMDLSRDQEFSLTGMARSEFSQIYRPLHEYRNNLLILDSLANLTNLGQEQTNPHNGSPATIFSASNYHDPASPTSGSGSASFDQLIAREVAAEGQLPSVEYGDSRGFAIWGAPGVRAPVENSAHDAFERLFPSGIEASAEPSREQRIAQARGSVLDFVQDRYDAVSRRLGGDDRRKVEAHRDLIRDLEQRLSTTLAIPAGANCAEPELPRNPADTTEHVELFSRVISTAFACDRTRVASLQLDYMNADEFGAPPKGVHGNYAHYHDDGTAQGHWTTYYRIHARQLASLLGALRAVPEADGSTLLDHTIVLWASEIGSWMHQVSHLPLVVAGGGGFRMGRYLYWGRQPFNYSEGGNAGSRYQRNQMGPSHSRLLVSIARQMGLDVDRVGNASEVTFRGQRVSLTGTLDRLV